MVATALSTPARTSTGGGGRFDFAEAWQGAEGQLHQDLEALLEAPQDRNGILHRGLHRQHRLEAPLEGRVRLDVATILVERRGADDLQLASRKRRLEQVGRIPLSGRTTGTNHGMGFIYKQDRWPESFFDLLDDRFQALFELSLYTGAGLQQPQVKRTDGNVFKGRRYVAGGDAQCKALGHRRLADTGKDDPVARHARGLRAHLLKERVVLETVLRHVGDVHDGLGGDQVHIAD